ncbi:Hypothetical protein PHPALM_15740 [Phytophthora palmivora]|uniref:DDE-1 domain-containing protein n=1 Tax=Phytophthora palmivora TaxID=4796 RepID=A0A2P4XRE5_9STRA|nr:Hypothetical protein PHPALM_15740 [Phytophthora palmivora]
MADKVFYIVYSLPANCTSTSQPLDVGIMGPLKTEPNNAHEKRVDIIKRTITAWNSISEKTVQSNFTKAI